MVHPVHAGRPQFSPQKRCKGEGMKVVECNFLRGNNSSFYHKKNCDPTDILYVLHAFVNAHALKKATSNVE
jgi:hypothetical protein